MTHRRSAASPETPDSSARQPSAGKAAWIDLEDGGLAQVVHLGDDVLLRLVDDALQPFVALHVDGPGGPGGRDGHLELTGKVVVGHRPMLAQGPAPRAHGSTRRTGRGVTVRGRVTVRAAGASPSRVGYWQMTLSRSGT